MKTINVIEISDTSKMSIAQLVAHPDNPQAAAEAEQFFAALVRENSDGEVSEEEMDGYIDDGYWESGNYWIGLVHSTTPETPFFNR